MDKRATLGVTVVSKSNTGKLGEVAATWAGKHTCPDRCPFLKLCYPHHGNAKFTSSRLDKARKAAPAVFAQREADLIDELNVDTPLRLHIYGDAADEDSASILGTACARFVKRTRQLVWTYTHAWDRVSRTIWGPAVSVLASCETPAEVKRAAKQGYACALTVIEFEDDKRHVTEDGIDLLPCPNQVAKKRGKKITCAQCRLCMNDEKLKQMGVVIGFELHDDPTGEVADRVEEKLEWQEL